MRIVSATHSTNPHDNGGCDYALVDLNQQLARRIQRRMKTLLALAAEDTDLHEAHYWDGQAEYFGVKLSDDDQELFECLLSADEGYAVLAEGVTVPAKAMERTECCHMVVTVLGANAEVCWRASPKNNSIYVETNPLPQALIERIASGGDSARA